jgi:pilus assembly protein FimV
MGGIAAVFLFLAALFGYRRWSANRAADEDKDIDFDFDESDEQPVAKTADDVDLDLDNLADQQPSDDWDMEVTTPVADVAATTSVQPSATTDVLGEADIYISFGNFDKAEAILKPAIASELNRVDYRLKLLEVFKETDNLVAFDAAYRDLVELDDDAANDAAGAMRAKLTGASNTPISFGVSSAAEAAGIAEELDFDLDLDFDATEEVEASASLEPEVVAVSPAAEEFNLDFDLDLDMDLNEQVTSAATSAKEEMLDLDAMLAAEKAAEADEFDFDLDMNFDLDETELTAPAVVATEDPDVTVRRNAVNLDATIKRDKVDPDATMRREAVDVVAQSSAETVVHHEEVSADDLGLDFDLDFDESTPVEVAAPVETARTEKDILLESVTPDAGDMDEELGFLADTDEAATKLDLARAYIDMGDKDGARDILEEVLEEGAAEQKLEAQQLLRTIGV